MMSKVRPLKSRIMGLDELRTRSLCMIDECRNQLRKAPYEDGPTDEEFIENTLEDFEAKIIADIEMERIKNESI